MKIVHTMIRVNHLDESLKFYCDGLGMKLLKKREYEAGRFTNVFVGYGSEETDPVIELTYNWDTHASISATASVILLSACRKFIRPVKSCVRKGLRSCASQAR
jgi:lactoylglutathione lyase